MKSRRRAQQLPIYPISYILLTLIFMWYACLMLVHLATESLRVDVQMHDCTFCISQSNVNFIQPFDDIYHTNCPAFRGTVLIFWSKISCCPAFYSLCPTFFYWFLGSNLSLNLIIFSYFYQICKNIPLLDKKSRFSESLSRCLLQAG